MNYRKILIADDELYVRLLVKSALDTSYSVREASDGEEALDITRTEKPDLVLMDILMPKVDGHTACYEIKMDQLTRGIPVIMLTGIDYETSTNLNIWILKLSSLANYAGNSTVIVDPLPGSDCTVRLPPSSRARSCIPAKPSLPSLARSPIVSGRLNPLPLSLTVTLVLLSSNSTVISALVA